MKLKSVVFPEPLYSVAVHPKTKADLDKLGSALARLAEEDPTLKISREPDTSETILFRPGETQLDVVAEKMQRKFGVGVDLKLPKVPYKETITRSAKANTSTRSRPAATASTVTCCWSLSLCRAAAANEFVNRTWRHRPKNFIPAVEKGVVEATKAGVLAGYPVVNVRAPFMMAASIRWTLGNLFKSAGRGLQEGHAGRLPNTARAHR